jgi:hypothetical protein
VWTCDIRTESCRSLLCDMGSCIGAQVSSYERASRLCASAIRYIHPSSRRWKEFVTFNILPYGSWHAASAECLRREGDSLGKRQVTASRYIALRDDHKYKKQDKGPFKKFFPSSSIRKGKRCAVGILESIIVPLGAQELQHSTIQRTRE